MSRMGQYFMENESGQETPEMEEYAYWRIYNDARFLGYPNEFHDFVEDFNQLLNTARQENRDESTENDRE